VLVVRLVENAGLENRAHGESSSDGLGDCIYRKEAMGWRLAVIPLALGKTYDDEE
jgi:hypothetical protein